MSLELSAIPGQITPGSRDLKLVGGFILQTDSVPRSMRLSKARGDAEMGGDIFKLLVFLRLLGILSVSYEIGRASCRERV